MNLHALGDSLAAELSRRAALNICLSRLTVDGLRTSSGVDDLTRTAGARARRRLLSDSGGHYRLVAANCLWLLLAADQRADDAAAALVAVLVLMVAGRRVRRLAALVRVRGGRGANAGLDACLFALQ